VDVLDQDDSEPTTALTCAVEMRAAPGKRAEFIRLCIDGVPRAVRAGCLQAEILVAVDDPDVVVIVERWPSEAVFRRFAAEERADEALMARYEELAVGMPALRRFVTVSSTAGGA
jgi:quinol monooxygenase YgiN